MAFTFGNDLNLGAWLSGLDDENAYNSILMGYDSTISDNTSTTQGVYSQGIIAAFPYLRSDGTPLVAGIGGSSGVALSQMFSSAVSGQGYTATARAAGATGGTAWTTAGGASSQVATEFTIASGVARTACAVVNQANVDTTAPLVSCAPAINTLRGSTRTYTELLGGDPFRLQPTSVSLVLRTFGSTPDDMRGLGCRQLPSSGTFSTANTHLESIVTATGLSGAGIKAVTVDCGSGYGAPLGALVNPVSTTTGTAYAFGYLGGRVYRTEDTLPAPGVHFATIATGGHSIGQWNSCLGVSGTGTTPNPYMPAADAQEYIRLMCGLGTGRDFPTHVIIWDGHNPTTNVATPGNSEITEFQAGVTTLGVANRVASINRLNAMADALSSPRPKVLFVCTPAFQDGYSGLTRKTWYNAIRIAAAQRGASVLDLHARTCPANIDQNGAMPYATLEPWYAGGSFLNARAGTTDGPIEVADVDWLHPGVAGAANIGKLFWESLIAATGLYPGIQTVGNRRNISGGLRPVSTFL